ncbi:MAG: FAD-dependent oxidoreductase [Candidatus Portnoybacteria bacterium]|nr:FAD-dependent oxidoreductase [Candidatus Portnoybacteria bacterium]
MIYDSIILGAGPAGLSAAVYAKRLKLKIFVLSRDVGGQAIEAYKIDNYLGMPGVLGVELVEKFSQHVKNLGVEIKEGIKEISILPSSQNSFGVKTNSGEFETKSIIIATGKGYRHLDVLGAEKFEGKGISYCTTCDAPLFSGKIVAVVGAGDAGQDAACQLKEYASKVYLINKYDNLRGDDQRIQDEIRNSEKIELINNAKVAEVKGDKFVSSLVYQSFKNNEQKEIAIQGIFVEIGSVPNSDFLRNLVDLNEKGEIIIDHKTGATSKPGIFAAGDVTDVPEKQIIIAAGDGAKAALAAYQYLKSK